MLYNALKETGNVADVLIQDRKFPLPKDSCNKKGGYVTIQT
jgi:hypothetical protein